MNVWSRYPFVRLLIPLICGIILCYYHGGAHLLSSELLILDLVIGIGLLTVTNVYSRWLVTYRSRWIHGLVVNLTLFLVGWIITDSTFLQNQNNHFSLFQSESGIYIAHISEQPLEKQNSIKVILEIDEIRDSSATFIASGKLLCYIKKDSLAVRPQYGDIIGFYKEPIKPEPPGNPGEFDYAGYLANQGIYHIVYLNSDDYLMLSRNKGNKLKALALNIQADFIHLLSGNGLQGDELAVAAALLTGYDDLLDADQTRKYSGAGVIHIMSVSGLHVGVIFMLAEFAFSFLQRRKRLAVLKPIMTIGVIWLYALITGLAPPVLRASLMFTLIILGKATQHQSNSINTLAAAAFILLIMNPRLIFNVGFQLSFSAVAGILAFQPTLRTIWSPTNPFIKYGWDLITVSLAAQVFTAPIAVSYFHQFPDYFLISNLLAIPLSGMIIYTGLLLLFTSFIPLVGSFFTSLLSFELRLLNSSVSYIEQLPGAVWDDIYLPGYEVILVILCLVSLFYWLKSSRKFLFYISLISVFMLVALNVVRNVESNRQQMIIFHKVNYHPVISFINGREHILLTDTILSADIGKANYQLEGLKIEANLKNAEIKSLSGTKMWEDNTEYTLPEFFSFNNKRIVIVSGKCKLPDNKLNIKVDYVLLCNNVRNQPEQITTCFPDACLIVDASNSRWIIERLRKTARDFNISLYDVKKSGALVVNL